jgi:hypothetical protein
MLVRKFASDPFREVASVTFDGSNGAGYLFYVVRYVGGGSETISSAEEMETRERETMRIEAHATRLPRSTTFGPGSMESLRLTSWTKSSSGIRWARLSGFYSVYCGMGNTHTVDIEIRDWATETDPDDEADRLLNIALEDWSDPCSEMEEM